MEKQTCKDLWAQHKNSRIADLRRLWRADQEGEDSPYYKKVYEDIGNFSEYGLAFDYVEQDGKKPGYWRYQISWGGPSEEFRFYADYRPDHAPAARQIDFVYMDWFDGHARKLTGKDEELMQEIWNFFCEIGSAEHAYIEATKE